MSQTIENEFHYKEEFSFLSKYYAFVIPLAVLGNPRALLWWTLFLLIYIRLSHHRFFPYFRKLAVYTDRIELQRWGDTCISISRDKVRCSHVKIKKTDFVVFSEKPVVCQDLKQLYKMVKQKLVIVYPVMKDMWEAYPEFFESADAHK